MSALDAYSCQCGEEKGMAGNAAGVGGPELNFSICQTAIIPRNGGEGFSMDGFGTELDPASCAFMGLTGKLGAKTDG